MKRLLLFLSAAAVLVSCSVSNKEIKYSQMPEYVKELPAAKQHKFYTNEGSLWSSSGNLVSDIKAYQQGDILTIIVNEQASSTNKSTTKLSEKSSSGSGLTTFLGAQNRIFKVFNTSAANNNLVNLGGSSSYAGSGVNSKADQLQAKITARVIKVLPNHRLFIRGEKQVFTNGEEQTLIITGIIDEYQITKYDTIDSEYISDAKIFYNGRGLVSDTENKGWLVKLWELLRPF